MTTMEDLWQAILGGAGTEAPRRTSGSGGPQDPLADLLQGILGAPGGPQPRSAQPAGTDLESIVGGVLGGILGGTQPGAPGRIGSTGERPISQPAPGGSITDFLGSIFGRAPMQDNAFLGPIVEKLAAQLGVPPLVAQMIVSFALRKLLPSLASGGGQRAPSRVPPQAVPRAQEGLDLDDLLDRMASPNKLDTGFFTASGMTQELALQTGMDAQTAAISLQEVFKLLGGALSAFQQAEKPRQSAAGARRGATQRSAPSKTSTRSAGKTGKSGAGPKKGRKPTSTKQEGRGQSGSKGSGLDSLLDGFEV